MKDEYTFIPNSKYEIKTPYGFSSFAGIRKIEKSDHYDILLSTGVRIKCSDTHQFVIDSDIILAKNLMVGAKISSDTVTEYATVVSIEKKDENIDLYDIVDVGMGSIFIVDGIVSHNCDFVSSGATVIDPEIIQHYKDTYVQDPINKRGIDGNLWVWQFPDYTRSYMVVADVARGDSTDNSAYHVIDLEASEQVAEYKGKIDPKTFAHMLIAIATEYNKALLVVENANVGFAVLQEIINMDYPNTFYMSKDLKYVDTERQMTNKYYNDERNMVPGFTTTTRTRPLIISKLDSYMRDRGFTVRSSRTIDELFTFIWKGNRAEALDGYNDDLVMALAIGLWVRDTALKLRQEGIDLTKAMLNSMGGTTRYNPIYSSNNSNTNPYKLKVGNEEEDLRWLLG